MRPEWQSQAACRSVSPELFFPWRDQGGETTGDTAAAAKAVCRGCPVQEDCLEYALVNVEKFGVWGGKTVMERRAIRVERGLRGGPGPGSRTDLVVKKGHGTESMYSSGAGCRCEMCRAAHAEYQRNRKWDREHGRPSGRTSNFPQLCGLSSPKPGGGQ